MIDDLRKMRDEAQVLIDASRRITQTDATQSVLKSRYNKFRHWYAPANGDQWPWDKQRRPGKIHVSINILKPAVDIDSRLQSILPRIHCDPPTHDPETEKRAEATEQLVVQSLEETGWDVWMSDLTKIKSLLGKGVIKAFWNEEDDRPDCSIIETPENLRVGWGSSDFTRMDWALYEYQISGFQAAQQYGVSVQTKKDGTSIVTRGGTKHDDPLGQRGGVGTPSSNMSEPRETSDYEKAHVDVWDYWYKKKGEKRAQVWNAVIVGTDKGRVVVSNKQYEEMPDIPYIIIENDHKPGDPDGMSTIEHLTDFQEEYNRLVSHWLQLIADNTDPAWQAVGPGADSVPPGIVPKAGEIIALGADIKIEPIEKPQNQVPLEQAIGALWDSFHKESGLPEITFGTMPGAQTSGRAMAVQIEAVQNRADPRRRRLYRGLRELILFWLFMAEQRDWSLPVTLPAPTQPTEDQAATLLGQGEQPETVDMPVTRVIKGMRRWKIIEPEITPRDNIEHANTQIQILNARGQSLNRFMDQIGVDSPLVELAKIIEERSNAALFPGDVQAQVSAAATLLQMRMQMVQMEQQMAAMGIQQGGQAQDMANQAQGAGFLQAQENQAQPNSDQAAGGEMAGLAPTGAGPGQPGSAPALGQMQSLIRGQPSGQAQVLQQTTLKGN